MSEHAVTVSTPRLEFVEASPDWHRTRCALAGRSEILRNSELFLPMTESQKLNPDMYNLYCKRAMWFNASSRTLDAWTGTLTRKPATVDVPSAYRVRLNNIDNRGTDINSFIRTVVREILAYGRYGILVDAPRLESLPNPDDPNALPWLCGYNCQSIISWRTRPTAGGRVLDQVTLRENDEVPHPSGFGIQRRTIHRLLELDADGLYQVRMFVTKDGRDLEFPTIYPKIGGDRLDYIPFVILGPSSLNPEIEKAPLADVVDANVSHYQGSADLEYSLYFTASPTALIIGLSDDAPLKFQIGGGALINLPAGASASYLEFSGHGLAAMQAAQLDKKELLASLGVSFLNTPKRAAETAEALTIKAAGESASLITVADVISQALTKCVGFACKWSSIVGVIKIELNRDLINVRLSAEDHKTLIYAVQSGLLSLDDYFYQLQQGEILIPGTTIDDAKARMQTQPPITGGLGGETPPPTASRKAARKRDGGTDLPSNDNPNDDSKD